MANYRRIATGNWSTLAEWEDDGGGSFAASGSLPGASDNVWSNNYLTTIDQDAEVNSITNGAMTGVSAGGGFLFSASYTLTATQKPVNTSTYLVKCNAAALVDVYIVGEVDWTGAANNTKNIEVSTNCHLHYVGDIVGGNGYKLSPIVITSAGAEVTITGSVTGGTQTASSTVTNTASGVKVEAVNATINVTGDVYGGIGKFCHGVYSNQVNTSVNVVGNVYGGANSDTNTPCSGIYIDGASAFVSVVGTPESTSSDNAIEVTYPTSSVSITGSLVNNAEVMAVFSRNLILNAASMTWDMYDGSATKTLYTASLLSGYPLEEDVKLGVTYGPASEFTGTYDPDVVDVAQLASDLLDEIQTSSHVVAQRLRAAATDDTVGQIVTATLGG